MTVAITLTNQLAIQHLPIIANQMNLSVPLINRFVFQLVPNAINLKNVRKEKMRRIAQPVRMGSTHVKIKCVYLYSGRAMIQMTAVIIVMSSQAFAQIISVTTLMDSQQSLPMNQFAIMGFGRYKHIFNNTI